MSTGVSILDRNIDWEKRLAYIVDMMREMSLQTDPQAMVRAYARKMREIRTFDGSVSLSRRDLDAPWYRITRSTSWKDEINPWKDKDRLPLMKGGLLSELIYGDKPVLIDELEIAADDPAAAYLNSFRSLAAVPMFDKGVALNMVIFLQRAPAGFARDQFPEWVWMSNLFGRATHNLVLSDELKQAYDAVDRELMAVAEIQRSLLPGKLPTIPTMDLAVHYHTSKRAGGDYYDFFPLPDGQWGIFVADVSGHGTPAAVLMAITHCIAHTHPTPPRPGQMLELVNYHLATHYTVLSDTFVTAFYGIYNPECRELTYTCAGHNPPRLKHCDDGTLSSLNEVSGLPLGIFPEGKYNERVQPLRPGDQVVFYTDGITEARNLDGDMFGTERLDEALELCPLFADALLQAVLDRLEQFTVGQPADDDRTLLVAKIS